MSDHSSRSCSNSRNQRYPMTQSGRIALRRSNPSTLNGVSISVPLGGLTCHAAGVVASSPQPAPPQEEREFRDTNLRCHRGQGEWKLLGGLGRRGQTPLKFQEDVLDLKGHFFSLVAVLLEQQDDLMKSVLDTLDLVLDIRSELETSLLGLASTSWWRRAGLRARGIGG